ncbi:UNVERIFIED_CONTAM: Lysosomal Pro-X carboxypeptidase [Sesamum angustifolium]|uniref:Lysosomal Pro-X carboxypeptidase n=1 Tax=Sesamum angustifolium TaxID=2727405 RepID=A0AAW2QRF4_9LAMI
MTPFRVVLFQFYPLLLLPLLLQSSVSHKIPRLSTHNKEALILRNPDDVISTSAISKDSKTHFYTQTLDHFNYAPQSYATFRQRYVVNSKYWGGPSSNSPIFAYLGAEAPLDEDLEVIGFLNDNAPHFKSLSVYIEHRFYGKSVPFGSMEKAMKNGTLRGYFSSAQAIADYAEVLLHVKHKFAAHYSPIIVVGGSYGGKLASWFRLKYPHIALGALASSAPILYFDNITPQNGYYSIVTKDFKEVSENCYQTIKNSWAEIDKVASKPKGLSILSQRFKTCSHLNNSNELKDFLDTMYSVAAQYNQPPSYPVMMVCKGIDGATAGTDVIGRIFAGVVSYRGNRTCYDTNAYNYPSETSIGWEWQTCSEIVMPIGRGENDTMFPAYPFDLHEFIKTCKDIYGIPPRPHWITTYYGGHDIKLVLSRFGSNIIFSNGLRDPYSSGGVLEDLSESIVAVTTPKGSHCLDILNSDKTDPDWLIMQRKKEIEIIEGWLTTYYADLHALKRYI